MPIFVKYQYQIAGEQDIKRSLSNVADHAERENARVARGTSRQRLHAAGGTSSRESASAVAAQAVTSERISEIRLKSAQQIAKAEERLANKSAREAERAHAKAEREKTRVTEKEARERAKVEEQWAKKNRQLKEEHTRAIFRHEQDTARQAQRFAASRANTLLGVGSGVARTVGGLASGAAAMAGIGGTALAANAMHEGMRAERMATGMANQMAGVGASPAEIAKQAQSILATAHGVKGFSTTQAIGAAREFGGISGDYDLGLKMLDELSQISLATDVDVADLGKLAGGTYMKLKTPGMSQETAKAQTLEAVRAFAGQGNVGSVEIKDLAMYGGRLTAGAAKFQGDRLTNMKRMGTLAQVAIGSGSAADAAEATEAAARFASDITEHAGKVGGLTLHGKQLSAYTDSSKTQLRGIKELIADVVEASGGSLPKMQDIFGMRSGKMAEAFQMKYLEAERANEALAPGQRQAKGKAGRAAIEAEFDKFDKASLSTQDQRLRAEAALATNSAQLDEAWKKLNSELAGELLPLMPSLTSSLAQLTPVLVQAVGAFANITKWAMGNPFAGLATLISGAFLKEIVAADVAGLVKGAVMAFFGLGSVPTAGGVAGTVGGAGAVVGTGAITATVAVGALGAYGGYKTSQLNQQKTAQERQDALITQEKVDAAGGSTSALAELQRKSDEAESRALSRSMSTGVAVMPGGGFSAGDTAGMIEKIASLFSKPASEQEKAAKAIQAAAERLSGSQGSSVSGAFPNRGPGKSPITG